jgi:Leu/Phe-tRNA-protein transferase
MKQNRAERIRTAHFKVCLSPDQKALVKKCAKEDRKSMSEWGRDKLIPIAKDQQRQTGSL